MHVSSIKPITMGMTLAPMTAEGGAGSTIPGKVAGLGRAAMIANFCNMIDDWIALKKKYAGKSDAQIPAVACYTYGRDRNGHVGLQKLAAADIASALLLAVA